MGFSLGSWRPRHLLAAWGAYWLGLAAVAITPPVRAVMRVADGTPGSGTATADFGDAGFSMAVFNHGQAVWAGSASTFEMMLWIAAPPMLLWIAWLVARPERAAAPPPAELRAPDPLSNVREQRTRIPEERAGR